MFKQRKRKERKLKMQQMVLKTRTTLLSELSSGINVKPQTSQQANNKQKKFRGEEKSSVLSIKFN